MGARFASVSGAPIAYDEESARATLLKLINSDESVVLVADENGVVGMLGAMIYRHYFNLSHITGNELFWWIDPEYRHGSLAMRMFRALEEWAAQSGAHSFTVGALHAQSPEKLSRFYDRNGYSPLESTYTKVLQ
jgi:GNAT superfamily N-acetyltransferase